MKTAFVLLGVFLLGLRGVMLFYSLPFIFYESNLFNPKFYASSAIVPSLGDLMLNLIVVFFLLLYLVNYYYKMKFYLWVMHVSQSLKITIASILVFLSFLYLQKSLFCFSQYIYLFSVPTRPILKY